MKAQSIIISIKIKIIIRWLWRVFIYCIMGLYVDHLYVTVYNNKEKHILKFVLQILDHDCSEGHDWQSQL